MAGADLERARSICRGPRHGEEALRLATMEGRGDTPIIAHACLGDLYFVKGDLEQAIRVLDQGLALCRASGNRTMLRWIAAALGSAYALQGRLAEGCALLEEGDQRKYPHGRAARSCLSGRLAQRGLSSGGTRRGGPAARAARHSTWPGSTRSVANEASRCTSLASSRPTPTPPDVAQAEAHYQQALALAEELGMRPLVAHCHLGLGTLYTKMGRLEQARAELSTAIELYRAMEMTFWLPQAEAALAQVV